MCVNTHTACCHFLCASVGSDICIYLNIYIYIYTCMRTHCNTLTHRNTTPHCNTLTHCHTFNTLQDTTTHILTRRANTSRFVRHRCNTLTHCNALTHRHAPPHCNTLTRRNTIHSHAATHYHTATNYHTFTHNTSEHEHDFSRFARHRACDLARESAANLFNVLPDDVLYVYTNI